MFSRERVSQYKPDQKAVLISITCPTDKWPFVVEDRYEKILRLKFDDVSNPTNFFVEMDDSQAARVAALANWAQKQKDDIQIVVNCDAGISRSSGTAAAIAKYFLKDDMFYFNNGAYSPNMLVYTKILQKLHGM